MRSSPAFATLLFATLLPLAGCNFLTDFDREIAADGFVADAGLDALNSDADAALDAPDALSSTACGENERVEEGSCTMCESGTTNAPGDRITDGTSACDPVLCATNEFVQDNICEPCAPGTSNDAGNDASGADTSCTPIACAVDERVESRRCVQCEAGTENEDGDIATGANTSCNPILCELDEQVISNECIACMGEETNRAGDDASGGNTLCDGAFCPSDTFVFGNDCSECPAGTDNEAGDDPDGGPTDCDTITCGENEYVQDNVCTACDPGSTSDGGDPATGGDTSCTAVVCGIDQRVLNNACVACAPGRESTTDDLATGPNTTCDAVLCAVNERVLNNTCRACPGDAVNAPGDDASGANTMCDGVRCLVDERVDGGACVPCTAPTTNRAGDRTLGADTTCDGALCASDEQVTAGSCTVCGPGEQNEAGDAPTMADTFCDAILCGVDERVSGNVCVPCAAGTSNAAGNDASGSDTFCQDACSPIVGVDCATFNEAYIKGSMLRARDHFGDAVALSGNTLVVGVPHDERNADGSTMSGVVDVGAVYVFVRTGSTWVEEAYLKASNAQSGDFFGNAVAISGDTLVVAAPREDGGGNTVGADPIDDCDDAALNCAIDSGAVYVFQRNAGVWSQQAYIKSSTNESPRQFGTAVAVEGDTVLAAADDESTMGSFSGGVFVYERTGSVWVEAQLVHSPEPSPFDRMGGAIALSGSTFAVSALGEDSDTPGIGGAFDNNAAVASGTVLIYTRGPVQWEFQESIKASNPDVSDGFGSAIALDGNTLVVAALREDGGASGVDGPQLDDCGADPELNCSTSSGAAYVFERTAGVWAQQAYLKASNNDVPNQLFGTSVAVSGNRVLIGALNEYSRFGGLDADQTQGGFSSGAVYMFERSGSTWSQSAYIKSPDPDVNDHFGHGVAMSSDTLVISVKQEDGSALTIGGDPFNNTRQDSGAVYIRRIAP